MDIKKGGGAVIKVKTRSHMGGRILNDSPRSETSPTEGLNLTPSLSIHLTLSLAEMQLIRIERAKCAEMERAGCTLAHAGGRTVSHSPEQIQIWGLLVRARRDQTSSRRFHLVSWSFLASVQSLCSPDREREGKRERRQENLLSSFLLQ